VCQGAPSGFLGRCHLGQLWEKDNDLHRPFFRDLAGDSPEGPAGYCQESEEFQIPRYIDEQAFRYNERQDEQGDSGRFVRVMSQIVGLRLTWDRLTGKEPDHRPTLLN